MLWQNETTINDKNQDVLIITETQSKQNTAVVLFFTQRVGENSQSLSYIQAELSEVSLKNTHHLC